jgi:hypothetical protein
LGIELIAPEHQLGLLHGCTVAALATVLDLHCNAVGGRPGRPCMPQRAQSAATRGKQARLPAARAPRCIFNLVICDLRQRLCPGGVPWRVGAHGCRVAHPPPGPRHPAGLGAWAHRCGDEWPKVLDIPVEDPSWSAGLQYNQQQTISSKPGWTAAPGGSLRLHAHRWLSSYVLRCGCCHSRVGTAPAGQRASGPAGQRASGPAHTLCSHDNALVPRLGTQGHESLG